MCAEGTSVAHVLRDTLKSAGIVPREIFSSQMVVYYTSRSVPCFFLLHFYLIIKIFQIN